MKQLLLCAIVVALGCGEEPPGDPSFVPPPVREGERVGNTTRSIERPDYQLPFYADSHVAPTAESRAAAERQMLEWVAFRRAENPKPAALLARACLPDGRFDAGGTSRQQAMMFALNPGELGADVVVNIYASPWFRSEDGRQIPNPKREVLYVLPNESVVRRVSPDRVRWFRSGDGAAPCYPGGPTFGQKTYRTPQEALGRQAPPPEPPPSRFLPPDSFR